MEYKLENSHDTTILVSNVNNLMENGWVPQGGLVHVENKYGTFYIQAMIKK